MAAAAPTHSSPCQRLAATHTSRHRHLLGCQGGVLLGLGHGHVLPGVARVPRVGAHLGLPRLGPHVGRGQVGLRVHLLLHLAALVRLHLALLHLAARVLLRRRQALLLLLLLLELELLLQLQLVLLHRVRPARRVPSVRSWRGSHAASAVGTGPCRRQAWRSPHFQTVGRGRTCPWGSPGRLQAPGR